MDEAPSTVETVPDAPVKRRGRPLDADRSDVILATVLVLVKEVGYDQIRMQDVADRAGVGLTTIYRRWPTKQGLVRAALDADHAAEHWPNTGDARGDVNAFLKDFAEQLSGQGGQTLLGFLTTLRSEPEVGDMFRETVIAAMQDHLRTLLASELGDDFPDLELRAVAGPAILIYQSAILGKPLDADAMAERLTQLLFAPAPQVD